MAWGQMKAPVIKQAVEGTVTEQIPASLLRNHPNFKIYADKDAASLLNDK